VDDARKTSLAGRTLAHYRINTVIGAGGMGEVYRATDTKLARDVALKILPPEMASDPDRLDRFQREARAVAALNHPNVVTVYSVEESDDVHFITMELIEGQPLDRLISANGLPVEQIIEIGCAIAEALAAAHQKGIVHRDLKPANVMLTNEGRVKVLDFGLAKDVGAETTNDATITATSHTQRGTIMGTPAYMSPEQISGRPLDNRCDIFSYGVMVHEMATGRRPFEGSSSAELISSILRDTPPSVTDARPDLPSGLVRVIRRCLEKDPAQRYRSTPMLVSELRTVAKAWGDNAKAPGHIEAVHRLEHPSIAPMPAATPRSTSPPSASDLSLPTTRQKIQFCVTGDGVRLAYASAGSGYPLVKAANWLNHLDYEWDSPLWRHWLVEMTRHHRLIRYDERGNGLSQWDVKQMSFELWVQDLEAVVDASGVDRFALLGISQGGAVAISYAIRHPERVSHIILVGAFSRGLMARGTEEQMAARRALQTLVRLDWGRNNPDFKAMFTRFYIPDGSTPEQQQWFNDLQHISATPENAARLMTLVDEINVRHLLAEVSVPTIIFHGNHDKVIPAEEGRIMAAEIPSARFVPLNTGNHILLAQEPAWPVFLDELGAFLGWQSTRVSPTTREQR
jgi:serine/threonine protein kinase/alpha-beta hydrolase superfamily lysophospholipase